MTADQKPGAFAFALAFVALSVFLLSQIGEQTVWAARKSLTSQPRFWPAVSLVMMVGFGLIHFWGQRRAAKGEAAEIWAWARGLEFAAWFIGYVWLVPVLGYLPATVLVALALTWRMGFRSRASLGASIAMALGIVIVFRIVLRVNLPGGQIYHALPEPLATVMLTYF